MRCRIKRRGETYEGYESPNFTYREPTYIVKFRL